MTKSQDTDERGPETTPLSGRRGWGGTIAALPVLLLFVFLEHLFLFLFDLGNGRRDHHEHGSVAVGDDLHVARDTQI